MDDNRLLEADQRWTVWKCNSHQEYLEKFFIKGKFHPDVPDTVRASYEIVERLIAYSYFHYPLIEEVISKMTRIFEMSVKIRAKALGITDKSLSGYLRKLKEHSEVDIDLATEWDNIKDIRNYYAHPEGHHFSGPIPLQLIYPMLNTVNRLFCPKSLFEGCYCITSDLVDRFKTFDDGLFILEMNEVKRLITCAQPYFISPDGIKSLWIMTPVGVLFPQTIDEYFDFSPIFARLSDLHIENDIIIAMDSLTNSKVLIYKTDLEGNVKAAESFNQKYLSADETVRMLFTKNTSYHRYFEKQKFIYDELWD